MVNLQTLIQDYGKQYLQRVATSQNTMLEKTFKEQDTGDFDDDHKSHMTQLELSGDWRSYRKAK